MAIEDITDRFEGLNPHDRIYSSASGYTVKVKTFRLDTGTPDRLAFRISGALCDDDTGRAKAFADGHFICQPHELAIHSQSGVTVAAEVEAARRAVVARVETAALNMTAAEAVAAAPPPPEA